MTKPVVFPAVQDQTPKALRSCGHDTHTASLEGAKWDYKATVKRALQCMDTAEIVRDKLSGFFVGQTPEAIRDLLLPEVAAYYACPWREAKSTGKKMLSASAPASMRTGKALDRLVNVITGEQSAHAEAVEEKEEKAAKAAAKEETPDATPEQIAAMLQLIQSYGMDRKLANKALSQAFALMKAVN
jgi:hypothetical protein